MILFNIIQNVAHVSVWKKSLMFFYHIMLLFWRCLLQFLTKLEVLNLYNNQIGDIKPLASLTNLIQLFLNNNQIGDIKPLASLTKLTDLLLSGNSIASKTCPLSPESICKWEAGILILPPLPSPPPSLFSPPPPPELPPLPPTWTISQRRVWDWVGVKHIFAMCAFKSDGVWAQQADFCRTFKLIIAANWAALSR